jgi:hypothetical protein
VCLGLCGCYGFGPTRISQDQLAYSRALGDVQKCATLLNVVRIRYGDSPTLLQATQVISAYQIQSNVNGSFEFFPNAGTSGFLGGGASAQFQQSPTFTFQPLSGEQFARSFIRPLSPGDLLPLAMSGTPIDVLFRLGVQSTNDLKNVIALAQTDSAGSPDFFLLLRDLRALQIAGLLGVRLSTADIPSDLDAKRLSSTGPGEKAPSPPPQASPGPGHVYFSIAATRDPALQATVDEAKRLLSIPAESSQAEIVYGRSPGPGQIAIVTRSVLGALTQVAVQIEVPPEDVTRHRTLPTVGNIGLEHRPVVIVHSGPTAPADVFASVRYQENWFWIAQNDFDSKEAFSVLQILLALAAAPPTQPAVVTIPAH